VFLFGSSSVTQSTLVVQLLSQTMVYRPGDVIGVARKADKKAGKDKKADTKPTARCDECSRGRDDRENIDMSHTDCPYILDYKLGRIIHVRFERAWSRCDWPWVPLRRMRENKNGTNVLSILRFFSRSTS